MDGEGAARTVHAAETEPFLWRELSQADGVDALTGAWLALQLRMVEGATQGAVWRVEPRDGAIEPIARWPADQEVPPALADAARRACETRQGVVRRGGSQTPADAELQTAIAYPIAIRGEVRGVAALVCGVVGQAPLTAAMRALQWGSAWLRDALRAEREAADGESSERARGALEILTAVLECAHFPAAVQTAASEIAQHCGAERVSVGFVRGEHAHVLAISRSAEHGPKMNLVRHIEEAMDEAIDQRAIVVHPAPPGGEPLTLDAHASLQRLHGAETLLTVPLTIGDRPIGAIVCESPRGREIARPALDLIAAVAALLAPVLEEKRLNDRWLPRKAGDALVEQLRHVFGPEHTLAKLVALSASAVLLFAIFATGTYRVTADAEIEGLIQRSIVGPFDGYVREAPVRAGDVVHEGDLLVAMDDRDLVLDRLRWVTERDNKRHEYERALSERNRAETNVVRTEIAKAEAQIQLVDQMLARAKLVAPFDGVVVAGDLSQSIGAAVGRGDALFQIAPLDQYRVVLHVEEGRVADLEVGQTGELVMTALPGEPLPIGITSITPVATVVDGVNVFRVEASLAEGSSRLRPGMEGVAKVDVDERKLVSIWTRTARDWMRMSLWRWLP